VDLSPWSSDHALARVSHLVFVSLTDLAFFHLGVLLGRSDRRAQSSGMKYEGEICLSEGPLVAGDVLFSRPGACRGRVGTDRILSGVSFVGALRGEEGG
jgi:hypothetical protein